MERSEQLPWLAIPGELTREKVFSDSRGGNRVLAIQPQRLWGILKVGPLYLLHFPNAIVRMFSAYDPM